MPLHTLDKRTGLASAAEPGAKSANWIGWGKKGTFAIADQVFMAGSNFLLNVILARSLSTSDYGAYTLAFSVFLLIANAYQAVLLVPSLVLGPTVYKERRRFYCGALLRLHVALSFVVTLLLLAGALYFYYGRGAEGTAAAMSGLAVSVPCVLLFWLARCLYYLDLLPGMAALGSALYAVVLVGGVYTLLYLALLSTFTAFVVTAAASLTLAVFLLRRLEPDFSRSPGWISLRELWRESWTYGRWELAIASTFWFLTNYCYILAAGAMDASTTGELRALQNIALPLTHAFGSALRLAVPYLSRTYESDGVLATSRRVYLLFGGAIAVSATYVLAAAALGSLPIRLLYDGKFTGYADLLPIILLTTLFWAGVESFAVGFRAMRYNQGILIAYLIPAALYGIAGYPMAKYFGFSGVVAGLVASHALAAVVALLVFRRTVSRQLRLRSACSAVYAA